MRLRSTVDTANDDEQRRHGRRKEATESDVDVPISSCGAARLGSALSTPSQVHRVSTSLEWQRRAHASVVVRRHSSTQPRHRLGRARIASAARSARAHERVRDRDGLVTAHLVFGLPDPICHRPAQLLPTSIKAQRTVNTSPPSVASPHPTLPQWRRSRACRRRRRPGGRW